MSPFRSITGQKEPVKRRQSRTHGTFGAILFVLLFVPARSKTGTMTVRLPLFCLSQLQHDYSAITGSAVCRPRPGRLFAVVFDWPTGQKIPPRRQQRLGYLRSGHCQ